MWRAHNYRGESLVGMSTEEKSGALLMIPILPLLANRGKIYFSTEVKSIIYCSVTKRGDTFFFVYSYCLEDKVTTSLKNIYTVL